MKKLDPCFYLMLFILLPSIVMSQDSVLSRSIDIEEGSGYGHTIIEGWNNNYIVASFTNCPYTAMACVGFVEINENLESVQKKIYHNAEFGNNFSGRDGLTVIDQYKLAFLSNMYKQRPDSSFYYSVLLSIMDTNMQLLDTFHFDEVTPGVYFARSIHAVGDSSLLISGVEADPPGSTTMGGAWLKKVRLEDGEIIWERKFDKAEYEAKGFESLEVLSNGDILLGMEIKVWPFQYMGKLTILNSKGKIKKQIKFDEILDKAYYPTRFMVTAIDDNTFGVNWVYNRSFDHEHEEYSPLIHAVKRDGTQLWEYHFDLKLGGHKKVRSIRSTSDGEVIGVGQSDWDTFMPDENILPSDPEKAGWAFKLNKRGKLDWEKFYYDPRHIIIHEASPRDALLDIKETPDRDFIMTGIRVDTIGPNAMNGNIWVLKTDSNGCLYGHYHCDTLQIVGDSTKRMLDLYTDVVYEWQESETKVYPNPASKQLNIEFNEAFSGVVKIVNMEGKKVLEQAIKNRRYKTLNISILSPGMYLLETFDVGNRKYSRTKIVVQ